MGSSEALSGEMPRSPESAPSFPRLQGNSPSPTADLRFCSSALRLSPQRVLRRPSEDQGDSKQAMVEWHIARWTRFSTSPSLHSARGPFPALRRAFRMQAAPMRSTQPSCGRKGACEVKRAATVVPQLRSHVVPAIRDVDVRSGTEPATAEPGHRQPLPAVPPSAMPPSDALGHAAAPPPTTASRPTVSFAEELGRLAELRDRGALSHEEFRARRSFLLWSRWWRARRHLLAPDEPDR